jgi:hypothetical protein
MLMDIDFLIRARRGDLCCGPDRINLYAFQKKGANRFGAQPLVFQAVEYAETLSPFVEIENRHAQQLMDDLWDAGIRPSEGTGSAGTLAATQQHLADIKTVAFHALKIPVKG